MLEWCTEHWILTFIIVVVLIESIRDAVIAWANRGIKKDLDKIAEFNKRHQL